MAQNQSSRWTTAQTKVLRKHIRAASSLTQGCKSAGAELGKSQSSCFARYYTLQNAKKARKVTKRSKASITVDWNVLKSMSTNKTLVIPVKSITLQNNALHITY